MPMGALHGMCMVPSSHERLVSLDVAVLGSAAGGGSCCTAACACARWAFGLTADDAVRLDVGCCGQVRATDVERVLAVERGAWWLACWESCAAVCCTWACYFLSCIVC